jgi:hypothetical protein
MLAMTQHNQQLAIQNTDLENLTEEELVGATSRDEAFVKGIGSK